jgi:L-ascorbate metabolism protein UlaG (beta-lactamase superfamily)
LSVQLEFVGHACFRLWQDGRPSIVMDPYAPSELKLPDNGPRLEADTVIVSSLTDPAHSNLKLVSGNPEVINALDVARGAQQATINGEPVVAIPAAEDPNHPDGPDDNALYAFKAGGLWFAHLGDLGFGLSDAELAPWAGHCDVLMAIVGEKLTVKLDELDSMIDFLKPTWIVPMHYELPPVGLGMSTIDKFLKRRRRDPIFYVRHHTVTFPLPRSERTTIVVLEPSGYKATG